VIGKAIGPHKGVQEFKIRLVSEADKTMEFDGPADITRETSDAIVNAANSSLLGGGGVDGAIHHAGGPEILADCRRIVSQIGSLSAGAAVITTGGRLAARHVIHTVGPVYHDGKHGEAGKLASCHRESIRIADEQGLRSISFPAISTGAFGYPIADAAAVAVSSTAVALVSARHVDKVRFVLFDLETLRTYALAAKSFLHNDPTFPFRIEKAPS